MNKTIYLRDEEGPIWERARELADDKLSPVIVSALRTFIAEREAKTKGFDRIQVRFNDADDYHLPKVKAFYGKWVYPPEKPLQMHEDRSDRVQCYAVAITAKGAAAVFSWMSDSESRWFEQFVVFPSLEHAAASDRVNFAARSAIETLGVPIEELDI